MNALILAAGRGSRMKGLTDDRPKCLVEVRGRSLLDRQLDALREGGVDNIGIVTGYRREALTMRGLAEFHNPRWEQTNMVSSLACAATWLRDAPCIVSYSDIFYESQAVTALRLSGADLAITYDVNWRALWERRFGDPLLDAETFRLSPNGNLAEIGSKPTRLEQIQGQYMGLLRFTPAGWAEVERIRAALDEPLRDKMHMTGTLQRVLEAGRVPISAIPYAATWGEIDSESDLSMS